jgi:uracil phosphoribosyltransferase
MDERDVIVLDPMLATGHSARRRGDAAEVDAPPFGAFRLPAGRARGLAHFHSLHPDVPITTCAIDS